MGTIQDLLAGIPSESVAISAPGFNRSLTFGGLRDLIRETALDLKENGIGRGDRVAIVLPNGPEMATAIIAISSCAACAPLNPTFKAKEFEFFLEDLGATILLVLEDADGPAIEVALARGMRIARLRPLREKDAGCFVLMFSAGPFVELSIGGPLGENDVALLLHTSGTTSRPKLVPLTHLNISVSAHNVQKSLALTSSDRD